jgi:hypothetical protein
MIGGHGIIQDPQAESFLCFKEPVIPTAPISGKFQKKLFLVATVGNVPHLVRNMVSVSSRHSYTLVFTHGNEALRPQMGYYCAYYYDTSICWLGPTLPLPTLQSEDDHDLHPLRAGQHGERAAESSGFIIFLDGSCSGILVIIQHTCYGVW